MTDLVRLDQLHIDEVSLVDEPASMLGFMIMKSARTGRSYQLQPPNSLGAILQNIRTTAREEGASKAVLKSAIDAATAAAIKAQFSGVGQDARPSVPKAPGAAGSMRRGGAPTGGGSPVAALKAHLGIRR